MLKPRKPCGFTLIEALVTLAVLAVLALLAAPSMQDFFVKNQMRKITNGFVQSATKARLTAVSKNTCTVMCASQNAHDVSPSCSAQPRDWSHGWIVFLNTACDDALQSPVQAPDLLEAVVTNAPGYTLELAGSAPAQPIMFAPQGISGLNRTLQFHPQYQAADHAMNAKWAQDICLDALGRTRMVAFGGNCASAP